MADRVKSSLEVCRNDRVKCFLAHFHQKIIPRDTGIVDQNIQMTVCLHDVFCHFFTGTVIRNIAAVNCRFAAIRYDFCRNSIGTLFGTVVIDDDKCTFFCKTFCDRSSDAAACTGNQCCFIS